MRIAYLFLSTFILSLIVSSCKQEQKPKNFIIPIDFSNSRDSSVIQWYKKTVEISILRKMKNNDRLIVIPIDRNSEAWGQEIFRIDFSKGSYTNEFAGLHSEEVAENNFQDSVESATRQFKESFNKARLSREKLIKQTDVFGALRQCQKYFSPGFKNTIVLLSDMQQMTESRENNFEDSLNNESEVPQFLEIAEIIDLKSNDVIVLTGPQVNISSIKFRAIRKFWEEYFSRCGARVINYSSGAVSKLEEAVSGE